MQKLISALIVYHHNIKMLHWNCKGKGFDATHEYLDNIAKQLNEYIDVIAEIMVSEDITIPTLLEAIEVLRQDDTTEHLIVSGEGTHDCKECAEATYNMLSELYTLYKGAKFKEPEIVFESDIMSIIDEHMAWIRKECLYKMKMRLAE